MPINQFNNQELDTVNQNSGAFGQQSFSIFDDNYS